MEEINMHDNDTYEKSGIEEKPSVAGKEKNRMKLLPIFAIALSIPPFILVAIGFVGSIAGLIGQAVYIEVIGYEDLHFLFWKVGAVVCIVNYLCAFACYGCSMVLGLISLIRGIVSFIKHRNQIAEMVMSAVTLNINYFFITMLQSEIIPFSIFLYCILLLISLPALFLRY